MSKVLANKGSEVEDLMRLCHDLVEINSSQSGNVRKVHHLISSFHGLFKKIKVFFFFDHWKVASIKITTLQEQLRISEQNLKIHEEFDQAMQSIRTWIDNANKKLNKYDEEAAESRLEEVENMWVMTYDWFCWWWASKLCLVWIKCNRWIKVDKRRKWSLIKRWAKECAALKLHQVKEAIRFRGGLHSS